MISRNLTRRLEQLEDQMIPAVGDRHIIQVVYVSSDGTRELGDRIEIPSYGPRQYPRRGAKAPQSRRRNRYR